MSAPVLVLGMHRSGTSAVTRALHLLGLDAGPPEARMQAAPSNQSGHWEIDALTAFNDRLLRSAGGRWSGPPVGEIPTDDADDVTEAEALLGDCFPGDRWVWKDPRNCLMFAFWRALIDPSPDLVVVLRDPRAIAASLAARNGFAPEYSLALWERHLRRLWASITGLRAIVVDYDQVLADPAATTASVGEFLGLGTPSADATASLDPSVRHHTPAGPFPRDPIASPEQRALFERSEALLGAHESFPAVELGPETPNLQLAFSEHARMGEYEDAMHRLEAEKGHVEAELDRQMVFLHTELERRSAEASRLAEDVMAARRESETLRTSLDRITNRMPVRLYLKLRRRS